MRKRKRRAVAKPDNADGQTKKYGNKKVVYDGIKFDSEREGNRYLFLCEQQRQGLITDLWVHPKYELIPKVGHIETEQLKTKTKQKIVVDQLAITYTADFLYRKKELGAAKLHERSAGKRNYLFHLRNCKGQQPETL